MSDAPSGRGPDRPGHRFSPRPNQAREIGWRVWGPDVFEEAARMHRPILLSISAVWCHWCHVMDETTLSDPAVQDLVREHYVAVRVDRDQRPDVDRHYNMGGWPTVAILNAAGSVLWGQTYVPPEPMARALSRVAEIYAEDREHLEFALSSASSGRDGESGSEAVPGRAGGDEAGTVATGGGNVADANERIADALRKSLAGLRDSEDPEHGGFGREGPKFPCPAALCFLAGVAASGFPDENSAREAEDMLLRALRVMHEGALWDDAEGGFYRYATQPDWSLPHFEKMLDDNVRLAEVFLLAGSRTRDPDLLEVGVRTTEYLNRVLWQAAGYYGMSQDADEGYSELPAEARRERAAQGGAPYVDPVLVSGPNLEGVALLVRAWAVTGDRSLRDRALALADRLWRDLWSRESGMAHAWSDPGEAPLRLMELSDQTRALEACLALLGLGRPEEREHLTKLADLIRCDYVSGSGTLLARSRKVQPEARGLGWESASLEETARLGRALTALAVLTEDRALEEAWQKRFLELERSVDLRRLGPFGGEIGLWGLALSGARVTGRIVTGNRPGAAGKAPLARHGSDADADADAFWAALLRAGDPTLWVFREGADEWIGAQAAEERPVGTSLELCRGTVCLPPLLDPAQVVSALTVRRG